MNKPESVLVRLAGAWAAAGLVGGLAYREVTKTLDFVGRTQLSVVHTHTLVLGTAVGLSLLALERLFGLARDKRFVWFLWVWNVGLVLTAGMLAVVGTLQVLGSPLATSPALAGVSGLGHVLLTLGFVLLFLVLGRAVQSAPGATKSAEAASSADPAPAHP